MSSPADIIFYYPVNRLVVYISYMDNICLWVYQGDEFKLYNSLSYWSVIRKTMQYHKQEGLLSDRVYFSHFLWWDSHLNRVKDSPDIFFLSKYKIIVYWVISLGLGTLLLSYLLDSTLIINLYLHILVPYYIVIPPRYKPF
jgi:hypothetical protein